MLKCRPINQRRYPVPFAHPMIISLMTHIIVIGAITAAHISEAYEKT
jgi:hypothetical protein